MGDTQRSPTIRIDFYLLKESFRQVRKSKSAGVDKITAKEYAKDLDENLYKLFDNIDHNLLRGFIKRRVNDGGMLRLIGKWLNAGVMEEGILPFTGQNPVEATG